jgi:hypothetical protein
MFAVYSPIIVSMGGERASTTRRRLRGEICARCKASLPALKIRGERLCPRCQGSVTVYMHFMERLSHWRISFLEKDLQTPLPRVLWFSGEEKIREMAARFSSQQTQEDKHALDHALSIGRGGFYLTLTPEQYAVLLKKKTDSRAD